MVVDLVPYLNKVSRQRHSWYVLSVSFDIKEDMENG